MGRLIDADKLEYTCNSDECGMLTGCNHCQYNIITKDEIDSAPTVEAIPKDQYEAKLKANMAAILTELKTEIEEKEQYYRDKFLKSKSTMHDVTMAGIIIGCKECKEDIQQKINEFKGDQEGRNDKWRNDTESI